MAVVEGAVVGLTPLALIVWLPRNRGGLLVTLGSIATLEMDDALLDAADFGNGGRHEGHGKQQCRRGANDRVPSPRKDHLGVPTR